MPYDDGECQSYLSQLNDKITSLQSQMNDAISVFNNLNSIKTKPVKTPHDDGSVTVEQVIPNNSLTGQPFSNAERDSIYDINVPKAKQVLGIQ